MFEDIMKNDYEYEKSLGFLESIFLRCPQCGNKCLISEVTGKYIIIDCDCSHWKINFTIKEI